MSGLSSATNVTQSAIATVAAQVNVVSQNIAGANTTGYSEQMANVASTLNGGVQLTSVTNSQKRRSSRAFSERPRHRRRSRPFPTG